MDIGNYFKVGQLFESKENLHSSLRTFCFSQNVGISSIGAKFICKFGKKSQNKTCIPTSLDTKVPRTAPVSLKGGCPFEIRFSGTVRKPPKNGSTNSQWDFSKPVKITFINPNHSCDQTPQSLKVALTRSGDYAKHLTTHSIFHLCRCLEADPKLDHRVIRGLVKDCLPHNVQFTGKQICNLRYSLLNKIRTLPSSIKDDYGKFLAMFPNKSFLDCIKCDPDTEREVESIQQCWRDRLNETITAGNKTNDVTKIQQMLRTMKATETGFDYRIAYDPQTSEVTGVIWMTASMRANLINYGHFVSFDVMHHEFNEFHWPYCGVALIREDGSMCLACEALSCSESYGAYKFVSSSMYSMCPGASPTDVLVVSADGRLNSDFVANELGMVNANFIEDRWHLINKKIPKIFGTVVHSRISEYMNGMVRAKSEEDFVSNAEYARRELSPNVSLLDKLDDLILHKHTYTDYIISKYPGMLGKVSSTPSEQNHSSIHSWLGSKYMEPVTTYFKDLYFRHLHRISEWDSNLFIQNIELARLANLHKITCPSLYEASRLFNLSGYKRLVIEFMATKDYTESRQGNQVHVRRIGSDAPPRIIKDSDLLCDCDVQTVHDFGNCRHFLKRNKLFISAVKISPRYTLRKSVQKVAIRDPLVNACNKETRAIVPLPQGGTLQATSDVEPIKEEIPPPRGLPKTISLKSHALTFSLKSQAPPKYKELKSLCDDLINNVSREDPSTRTYIAGMLISMNSALRNTNSTHTRNAMNTGTCPTLETLSTLWTQHVNKFSQMPMESSPSMERSQNIPFVAMPSKSRAASSTTKRMKDQREEYLLTSHKRGKKNKPTCSFCKLEGHKNNSQRCKKATFGIMIQNPETFKDYILRNVPYSSPFKESELDFVCTNTYSSSNGKSRHLQVKAIYPPYISGTPFQQVRFPIEQLLFRVSIIGGKRNDILRPDIVITGTEVSVYISNASPSRHIFDKLGPVHSVRASSYNSATMEASAHHMLPPTSVVQHLPAQLTNYSPNMYPLQNLNTFNVGHLFHPNVHRVQHGTVQRVNPTVPNPAFGGSTNQTSAIDDEIKL